MRFHFWGCNRFSVNDKYISIKLLIFFCLKNRKNPIASFCLLTTIDHGCIFINKKGGEEIMKIYKLELTEKELDLLDHMVTIATCELADRVNIKNKQYDEYCDTWEYKYWNRSLDMQSKVWKLQKTVDK